jgi:hypothetical protein
MKGRRDWQDMGKAFLMLETVNNSRMVKFE